MKILIDDYTFLDLDAPTLPAYEAFVSGSVYWLVWCDHCGKYYRRGTAAAVLVQRNLPGAVSARINQLAQLSGP